MGVIIKTRLAISIHSRGVSVNVLPCDTMQIGIPWKAPAIVDQVIML